MIADCQFNQLFSSLGLGVKCNIAGRSLDSSLTLRHDGSLYYQNYSLLQGQTGHTGPTGMTGFTVLLVQQVLQKILGL